MPSSLSISAYMFFRRFHVPILRGNCRVYKMTISVHKMDTTEDEPQL